MKSLIGVNPISDRYVEGLNIMGRTTHWYHQIGRHETADKMLKKAIRLYEKYRGEFSESSSSVLNDRVVAKLDGASIPVLLGYVQLLASMKRDNEVVDMRQRVTQIVCDSMAIRSLETTVLDKFDDLVALNAIQKEHRRERDYDGHSM
ncbi:hypothetical protein PPTG_18502 [Phytophthora nicotianae INRA-310]|uniref:Uncharacterized protein n=1 Tax=Phytophthora nicotianae (strain INRA-310) TaxID=761204 RepID=W2PFC9_PHYN3|nr:hypothetical protein PPTG_18502 [Phytophthora nicotianae INRA-310]ETM99747.1 hypothetical protein PPTG_18502 [Phytophthora nicotianae INRA-310]